MGFSKLYEGLLRFHLLYIFIPDYGSKALVIYSFLLTEDDEDAEAGGDVDDEQAVGSYEEEETEGGGKLKEQEDEFTDKTREAEFSLELNLPADGEQEKANTSRDGLDLPRILLL